MVSVFRGCDLQPAGWASVAHPLRCQKSMSGISVTKQTVALFAELKSKSTHRFLTFRIDKGGTRVRPPLRACVYSSAGR